MSGYVSEEVRQRVREQAGNRCGYCLSPQHLVLGTLEIEHLIPRGRGGSDEEDNLWLACRFCNSFKAQQRNENPRKNALRSGNRQRTAIEQYGRGDRAKVLDSGRLAPASGGGMMEC